MAWILLEGLDRSGKSSVAEMYKKQGFDVVHMSAPDKKYFQPGYSGPSYLEEIVDMYSIYKGKDVVFDRTIYGEKVWPEVFNRIPCLNDEDYEYLQSLEYNEDAVRIYMKPEDQEAHWQRCVQNKEPLNRLQFVTAGRLYDELARKYNFETRQLSDFSEEDAETIPGTNKPDVSVPDSAGDVRKPSKPEPKVRKTVDARSLESKLSRANAIRTLLDTSLVRKKGPEFEELEQDIKNFLEKELKNIFTEERVDDFTQEEVQILKVYASRIKEKLG